MSKCNSEFLGPVISLHSNLIYTVWKSKNFLPIKLYVKSISKLKLSKSLERNIFEIQNSRCKIWLSEKLSNFHTVIRVTSDRPISVSADRTLLPFPIARFNFNPQSYICQTNKVANYHLVMKSNHSTTKVESCRKYSFDIPKKRCPTE